MGIFDFILGNRRKAHKVFKDMLRIGDKYGIDIFLQGIEKNKIKVYMSVPATIKEDKLREFYRELLDVIEDFEISSTVVVYEDD